MIWYDVDTALAAVPVNIAALIDDTDFKTREESVTFDQAGLDLVWNFVTTAGAYTQTAVTPTESAGVYDWTNVGNGMYAIEMPASGGGTINNDTEGFGWFTGFATGILPWTGPVCGFRAAALNNSLVDAGTTGLLAPTTAARTLDVTATGAAGIDWGNVENPTTAVDLSGTDIQLCDTTTTNTDMRGTDSAALASVCTEGRLAELDAANLPADVDGIKAVTDALPDAGALTQLLSDVSDILTDTGTTLPATVATIAGYIDTEIAAILDDTANTIPGLISALENISTTDVQTQCAAALVAIHLDHLVGVADPGGIVANSSLLAKLVSKSATPAFASFDNTTDSLEALRDTQADVEADTQDLQTQIGTAGAGLTALGDTRLANLDDAVSDAVAAAAAALTSYAAAQPSESYGADGAVPTRDQFLFMILQALTEFAIVGTTLTTKKLDKSTTAMTHTLDDDETPTSRTRAT